jgi:hypothetical protein
VWYRGIRSEEMEPQKKVLFFDENKDNLYDKIRLVEDGKIVYKDITSSESPKSFTLKQIKEMVPTIGSDDLLIKKSSIEAAGYGVFAHTPIRKDQIVTFYQGPIFSKQDFDIKAANDIRYKTHARQLIPAQFIQVGNMNEETGEWIGNPSYELHDSGIGPYINDPRDPTIKGEEGLHREKLNVTFVNIDTRGNQDMVIKTFKKPGVSVVVTKQLINFAKALPIVLRKGSRLVAIVATRPIKSGEELFINYGETHFDIFGGYSSEDTSSSEQDTSTGEEDSDEDTSSQDSGIDTELKCLACSRPGPSVEEIHEPDRKFCDQDCRDNHYGV